MAKVKIRRQKEFTPKWDNNAKKEKPVKVIIRYLTPGEIDDTMVVKYDQQAVTKVNPSGVVIEHDDQQMIRLAVTGIDNLEIEDETGATSTIKTGQEMIDTPGLEGLFYECLREIKSMNARVDTKN